MDREIDLFSYGKLVRDLAVEGMKLGEAVEARVPGARERRKQWESLVVAEGLLQAVMGYKFRYLKGIEAIRAAADVRPITRMEARRLKQYEEDKDWRRLGPVRESAK